MIYIRSLFYLIGQVVSAIVVCLLALLLAPLPSLARAKVIGLWARFNIWTLKWVCGIDCRVSGKENIPQSPSVIISNHQSAWETLYFQIIFPPQSYLLKKQLLWIPFFGWGLALNRPIAIDRAKKTRALDTLIKQGKERLAEGRWLVVFPEGTRREPGQLGEFQVGGAMMAVKSGCSVVPVSHNAGEYWGKGSFLKYPGTIDLIIGPEIKTEGKKVREVNQLAQSWISANQKKL